MSTSVNKVTLLGNLGQEPELKTLTAGATICNLSVATNEQWIDEKKGVQERGRVAESCRRCQALERTRLPNYILPPNPPPADLSSPHRELLRPGCFPLLWQ
jgi:hypothetical protein